MQKCRLWGIVATLLLCAFAAPASALTLATHLSSANDLVAKQARSMLGTHYRLGANSGTETDCSGLMQRIYTAAGIHLPRTTRGQVREGVAVGASDLRRGDLLFYRWGRHALHVAIYRDTRPVAGSSFPSPTSKRKSSLATRFSSARMQASFTSAS